jgi:hypothetical protein
LAGSFFSISFSPTGLIFAAHPQLFDKLSRVGLWKRLKIFIGYPGYFPETILSEAQCDGRFLLNARQQHRKNISIIWNLSNRCYGSASVGGCGGGQAK